MDKLFGFFCGIAKIRIYVFFVYVLLVGFIFVSFQNKEGNLIVIIIWFLLLDELMCKTKSKKY